MKTKVYITNIEPLGDEGLFQSLYELMPACRREKIDRLKCVPDKYRSLAVGALLMYALKKENISLSTPVKTEENGKPYLEGNPVYFNLSHSGDMAMCVISDTRVGCDIELMKKQPNLRVAQRFFSEEEYKSIKEKGDFYKIWTLKESFVKLSGEGIKGIADSFSFDESCDKIYCESHFMGDYCYSFVLGDRRPETEILLPDIKEIKDRLYED